MKDKKLYRSRENRMLAGVCGGIAEYLEMDPTVIRLIRVILCAFAGSGVLAYIIAAFSALRLAKFNLDTRQTTSFIGLPTPANALFWGSLIVGFGPQMMSDIYSLPVLIIGIVISSWLLVAEIPMFALKFKHWGFRGNEVKYGFVIFSAIAIIGGIAYGVIDGDDHICYSPLSVIILAYIAVSIATQKK